MAGPDLILETAAETLRWLFQPTNRIPHYSQTGITELKMIQDDKLDDVFEAVAETVEEAVISSLYHAKTVTGIRGRTLYSLLEFL